MVRTPSSNALAVKPSLHAPTSGLSQLFGPESLFTYHMRSQLEAQRWSVSGLDTQPKLSGHCEPLEMQPRVAGSGLMVSKDELCSGRHLRPWLAFA